MSTKYIRIYSKQKLTGPKMDLGLHRSLSDFPPVAGFHRKYKCSLVLINSSGQATAEFSGIIANISPATYIIYTPVRCISMRTKS